MAAAATSSFLPSDQAGKLTIGTDNPAYPPYFLENADGSKDAFWQLGVPMNGLGFESAVAYAIASELGFEKGKVEWTYIPFDLSYAPGAKAFDLDINQVSYLPERATAVDLSEGYYYSAQAVVTLEGSTIAGATTVADLKGARLGAQQGTTSYKTITDVIVPSTAPSVYDTNDVAIQALIAGSVDVATGTGVAAGVGDVRIDDKDRSFEYATDADRQVRVGQWKLMWIGRRGAQYVEIEQVMADATDEGRGALIHYDLSGRPVGMDIRTVKSFSLFWSPVVIMIPGWKPWKLPE